MKKKLKKRIFLGDERAVSEEFSLLPALSIVMVGFALFVILIAQTYTAYTNHVSQLQSYQTAAAILQKVTSPDCYFIKPGGLLDLYTLQNNEESLTKICSHYKKFGIFFFLRLAYDDTVITFPESSSPPAFRCISVSRQIGIYLNEAQTTPGVLTILLWGEG